MPYKPPGTFKSTYLTTFGEKGDDLIGSPNKHGIEVSAENRNRRPRYEIHNPFIGSSSYSATFADFGALPKANLKAQKKFVAGFGNVNGLSTYANTFIGGGPEDLYKKIAEERRRVKQYAKQQDRGNLAPEMPVPFKGESAAQREFKKPEDAGHVVKQVPFNMVSLIKM